MAIKEKYFCCNSIETVARNIISNTPYIRPVDFDIFSSALLVVDMQDYFLEEGSHAHVPSSEAIVKNIKHLIDFFKSHRRPIFFTQHMNNHNNAKMMGVWWNDILNVQYSNISTKLPLSDGFIITKTQYDAFFNTDLEKSLETHNTSSVVVTGVTTHLCCETTVRSAFVRGYKVFFPVDSTATYTLRLHEASVLNLSHGFAYVCVAKDIYAREEQCLIV